MNCVKCNQPIPPERLAAIDTDTCVNCSNVRKYVGFMDFAHKTGGEAVVIDLNARNALENLRRAKRVNERKR